MGQDDERVGFRETPLGLLPEEWRISSLGEVLAQRIRKVRLEPDKTYVRLGVRWYAQGPFKKDAVKGRDIRGTDLYEVRESEFIYNRLFAWKGSFGVIPGEMNGCFVSGEFPAFEVDHSIADPHYIWRWFSLPSVWKTIEDRSTGSTRVSRLRFKTDDLLAMHVPLPPLPEQHAIAGVLLAVQRAVEATEQVIAAARELKRAMMRHLFMSGPVAIQEVEKIPLRETEVGLVPKHWEVVRLGSVVTIKSGQVDPREEPYGQMLHVGPENIESGSGHLRDLAKAREIGLISGKYLFTESDVLYSKIRPYLRKAALPDFTGICSADMYPLRPNYGLCRAFLFFWLLSDPFTAAIVPSQARTGIPKVNREQLNATPLLLPPYTEQCEIARLLAIADHKIAAEEARKAALEDLFKTLLHHLMTGQVRVQGVVRGE